MTKNITTVREIRLQYKPKPKGAEEPTITTAEKAYEVLIGHYDRNYLAIREEIIVLYLNSANQVQGVYKGFSGGITASVVDIRLIMAVALKGLSTGIIISHNHPSGTLNPSEADKKLTEQLRKAAELFSIKLLDHVIVTPHGTFYSFADEGML